MNRLPAAMSDQDEVKPYHSRNVAPGQEAADVVAEVLQHAQEREQAAQQKVGPKAPPKWMLPLTVNLGVLALYFLIAQPDFIVVTAPQDPRSAVEVDQQARGMIYLYGVQKIDLFLQENGRLPSTLAEVPMASSLNAGGVTTSYTPRGDSTYVLSVTLPDGGTIEFDSAVQTSESFAPAFNLGG